MDKKSERILITGAAGFIGSHTVDYLLNQGYMVFGIDNFRSGRLSNLEAASLDRAFVLIEGDVAEPGFLTKTAAAVKPSAIIHLAALVGVSESFDAMEVNFRLNVQATHEVGLAAQFASVRRVVFASSAAVYRSGSTDIGPSSPYGAAKLASEQLLLGYGEAFGFSARNQRYFNVYGPRQNASSPYSGVISIFCDALRSGTVPTIYGDGGQTRDFISVFDVARANALAATLPDIHSGTADICTGATTSLNNLYSKLAATFMVDSSPNYRPPRTGDIRHSVGNPTPALQQLGFTASISVAHGLADLARHIQSV